MKILIISSYFGPETSVGVLRVNAFANHWSRQGHEVHVLTMPFTGELPAGLRNNPLIHVQQIAPWLIRGGQAGGVQGYSKGVKGWRRVLLSFQYWLKRRLLSNYLDPRVLWWPRVALVGRSLLREQHFDLLYSTVPSYTAHSAAAWIKQGSRQLFWVADYRDLWAGNPIFPGCAPVRAFERWHERTVLARADLICSINTPLLQELRELHGPRDYLELPNGFEDSEVDVFRNAARISLPAKVNIVYAGSILPGLQNPTPLFLAIRQLVTEGLLAEGDLAISFYGDYAALDDFPVARDPLVAPFVKLAGKVPRQEILAVQKSADFLLFLGSQPVADGVGSTKGVVSGKIFEYLISGTEVLAVGVTDDMLVADMLRQAAVGTHYAADVARIRQRLLAAVQGETAKVQPNMDYLDQFRRSVQAAALLDQVRALKGSDRL
ncbi:MULTISPECIES: glycosyltransferase [Gammaproteobacteria]|uniref:Glycosyltransferase subfamily 4-like N-terminal domain-containing protein n=1 Tax=Bowmanella yangjiangensis TaxID=2811230 RepID=A0ABS3D290_9ALTE|nr:glycosyltransferase [Pseudomonas sp. REST10]MBN7822481.1 hypothetical protein [Bowmanella yangjiangensis]WFC63036.1 hypothetical protein EWH21_15390 [Pseudomonas sp. REST10]